MLGHRNCARTVLVLPRACAGVLPQSRLGGCHRKLSSETPMPTDSVFPDPARIRQAIADSGFGSIALASITDPGFQRDEVDYKLRLSSKLRAAKDALALKKPWLGHVQKAINARA